MSPLPRHFVSCFTLPMLLSVKKNCFGQLCYISDLCVRGWFCGFSIGFFFPYFKLFSGKFPAVFLLYVILRTHRRKNFNSLLPYVVFLKLSLCAAFHEDAIVKAIVFRQRVSFSFLRKCMWMQLTFHAWNVFLKDQWTQLPKMYSNVSIFLKYPGNK